MLQLESHSTASLLRYVVLFTRRSSISRLIRVARRRAQQQQPQQQPSEPQRHNATIIIEYHPLATVYKLFVCRMSFSEEQISQLAALIGAELSKENGPLATKEDLLRIEKKVDTIERKVNVLEHKVDTIERNVEALVRNVPNVALKSVAKCVVYKGTKVEERAIEIGADSTWTYMRHGDKLLAVSAAHCAIRPLKWGDSKPPAKKPKKSKNKENGCGPAKGKDTWQFCKVPLILAPFVKSAFFCHMSLEKCGTIAIHGKNHVAIHTNNCGDLLFN
jgi:hypothetical protein